MPAPSSAGFARTGVGIGAVLEISGATGLGFSHEEVFGTTGPAGLGFSFDEVFGATGATALLACFGTGTHIFGCGGRGSEDFFATATAS